MTKTTITTPDTLPGPAVRRRCPSCEAGWILKDGQLALEGVCNRCGHEEVGEVKARAPMRDPGHCACGAPFPRHARGPAKATCRRCLRRAQSARYRARRRGQPMPTRAEINTKAIRCLGCAAWLKPRSPNQRRCDRCAVERTLATDRMRAARTRARLKRQEGVA
jgi:hypothetical protein